MLIHNQNDEVSDTTKLSRITKAGNKNNSVNTDHSLLTYSLLTIHY